MFKLKKCTPEGMQDLLFEECQQKLYVENYLRDVYRYNGFSEIISPTLEFYDVFNFENQPISQEKMYKLFDNNGRILVLRPDMTMPIARIVATKIKPDNYPLKLSYTSNIFRINEKLKGKKSEITQSGIEIIGVKSLKADAEIIITAIESLLGLGLKKFKIELGQSGFFKELIKDENVSDDEIEKLKELIENKNYCALSEFLQEKEGFIQGGTIEVLKQLPKMFGDINVLYKAKQLIKNKSAINAIDEIYSLYEMISKVGLGSYISIDLGMIQDIDYYTGIIFKGYIDGVGDYILSGGRYDNLINKFGCNLPSTGFAINVDNIITALRIKNIFKVKEYKKALLYCKDEYLGDAYKIINLIQQKKIVCEMSLLDNVEDSISYAKGNKVDKVIIVDKIENIKIYDVKSEESIELNIDKFLEAVDRGV